MKEKVKEIAVSLFKSVLKISSDQHGTFRLIVTAKIQDEDKPLLILGNAHSEIEDGHCIAILNPDKSILNKVVAGCSYPADSLKEIVGGKCDLTVDLWIDAYKTNGVSEISSYKARNPKPAQFKVE